MSTRTVAATTGVVAYPDRQETITGSLFHVTGLHHPDCRAAAVVHKQRRNRVGLNRYAYLMLLHSACNGCAHHPRNEYGTWVAEALNFPWRAWAGYLYGPVVVSVTIGTRKRAHGMTPHPEAVQGVLPPIADARQCWDMEQLSVPPEQRAAHRLAQWHATRPWEQCAYPSGPWGGA